VLKCPPERGSRKQRKRKSFKRFLPTRRMKKRSKSFTFFDVTARCKENPSLDIIVPSIAITK
jgi:hypothetical protein